MTVRGTCDGAKHVLEYWRPGIVETVKRERFSNIT